MFVLKSTHKAEVSRLEREIELAKAYAEQSDLFHGVLIGNLKSQIEDLKKLIFIPKSEPSREVYEVDAVISGSEKPVEQSEAERNAFLEGERELDLLVSGNYSEDLLN